MADLIVEKKDGRQELFERSKILNGLIKAGASQVEAESITAQVESWASTVAVNNVVKTLDIKAKVLELLRGVNPTAAAAFAAYQKPTTSSEPPSVPPTGASEPPPMPPVA